MNYKYIEIKAAVTLMSCLEYENWSMLFDANIKAFEMCLNPFKKHEYWILKESVFSKFS